MFEEILKIEHNNFWSWIQIFRIILRMLNWKISLNPIKSSWGGILVLCCWKQPVFFEFDHFKNNSKEDK